VATVDDLFTSRQLVARQFFQTIDHPAAGNVLYPGAPFTIQEAPWRHARAPLLGEQNGEIYGGRLGLSMAELACLRGAGII
jgi:crotonobetainyl-CoA:carnitine CoA-transferase CaiB-like acyl-CoA transferase